MRHQIAANLHPTPVLQDAIKYGDEAIPMDTLVINLGFNQLGCLYTLGEKFNNTRFKTGALVKIRKLFLQKMEAIGNNHMDLRSWKQFFLLPYVFFTTPNHQIHMDYISRFNTEDGWDSLTLRQLFDSHRPIEVVNVAGRSSKGSPNPNPTPTTDGANGEDGSSVNPSRDLASDRAILSKIRTGKFSKAMSRLCSRAVSLSDGSIENVGRILQAKHPGYGEKAGMAARVLKSVADGIDALREDERIRKFVDTEVYEEVFKADSEITGGVDRFTMDHLKIFMGTPFAKKAKAHHNDTDENRFCSMFTAIVNMVAGGNFPNEITCFISMNLLIPLPKSDQDLRPIGISCLLRKVVSKLIFKNVLSSVTVKEHLQPFQLAMEQNGMTTIIANMTHKMHSEPDYDSFFMDADNAFNSAVST